MQEARGKEKGKDEERGGCYFGQGKGLPLGNVGMERSGHVRYLRTHFAKGLVGSGYL